MKCTYCHLALHTHQKFPIAPVWVRNYILMKVSEFIHRIGCLTCDMISLGADRDRNTLVDHIFFVKVTIPL